MKDFPTIEVVHKMLDEISEEIPVEFYNGLNEGIVLLPESKIHPESRSGNKLYIMGEYSRSITGRNIVIYYGSFRNVHFGISEEDLREELKHTLLHEFTHHLESRAGERGLEIKDQHDLNRYREK